MALRSVVSRVAQRGPAKAESEPSPLDNLRPEVPEEEVHEEQEVEVHLKDDPEPDGPEPAEQAHIEPRVSRGAAREPAANTRVQQNIAEDAHMEPAKKQRKPRSPNKPKVAPTESFDTSSAPQIRARLKEVEQDVADTRKRHAEELHVLRSKHAELHAKLFDHVK